MNERQTTCNRERIELFLCDQLGEAEQTAFEQHLESCRTCRTTLDDFAADADLWHETRENLRDSDLLDGSPAGSDFDTQHGDRLSAQSAPDVRLGFLGPTDDPRMLGRFGGYEIAGVIGYGGMGIVLKGLDSSLNRYVAIKVLSPHLAASGAARRRFAREAQAAAAVVHENVVAIHGVAECGGLPFFVMPYVRGSSLQKRIDEQGPLATAEVLRIGMQTAVGLAAAHAQGLVHRDIKPANILLADGVERVKITDFGLARAADDASLTRTGMIAGTPQYMSPEQARGEVVDARSDLFSLGSLMYAMCTGRPPFRAETSLGVLQRISDTKPRPIQEINAEIPAWLAGIVGRLHESDPDDRIQSADELAELLEQCLAHVQQPNLVELPDACRSEHQSQASSRTSPFSKLRTATPLVRWTLLVSAAVLTTAFAAILIASNWGPEKRARVEQSAESASDRDEVSGLTPPALSVDESSAFAWDDGVDERVQSTRQRALVLKQNSEQLWELTPSSTLSETSSK